MAVCDGCLHWLLAQRDRGMVRAVPVLAAADQAASMAFWAAAGFDVDAYSADFAARRAGRRRAAPGGRRAGSDRDRGGAYLHVHDVDATHDAWAAAGLPVSAVRDEPWGMREFHVVDPGGNRVRIGRSIPRLAGCRQPVVAAGRHLPGVRAQLRRLRRRRHRRPARRAVPPGVHRRPGRRRHLAEPVLPVPPGRRRLRRVRLPRRRPRLRHPGRLRRPGRRRPPPRAAGDRRPRPQPHVERAPVVPGRAGGRGRAAGSGPATSSGTDGARRGAGRPTTGRACSGDRPGPGPPTASGTCTCSPPSSPTSTGPTTRCGPSSTRSCASGSTGASTGSASTSPTAWPRTRPCPTWRSGSRCRGAAAAGHPYWDRDDVHDVYRQWRRVTDSYDRDVAFVAEAWVETPVQLARYLRPDELHTAFNFEFLQASWDAAGLRTAIDTSIDALAEVGAPPTWVLSNHDVVRHVTRYGGGEERRAPGPGRGPAHAGPARRRLRLPGRGAGPAPGHRPARRGAAGPDVLPHRRRRAGSRRLPGAAAVVGRRRPRSGSGRTGPGRGCRSRRGGTG